MFVSIQRLIGSGQLQLFVFKYQSRSFQPHLYFTLLVSSVSQLITRPNLTKIKWLSDFYGALTVKFTWGSEFDLHCWDVQQIAAIRENVVWWMDLFSFSLSSLNSDCSNLYPLGSFSLQTSVSVSFFIHPEVGILFWWIAIKMYWYCLFPSWCIDGILEIIYSKYHFVLYYVQKPVKLLSCPSGLCSLCVLHYSQNFSWYVKHFTC